MYARNTNTTNNLLVIGILLGCALHVLSNEGQRTKRSPQFSNLIGVLSNRGSSKSSRQYGLRAAVAAVPLPSNNPRSGRNGRQAQKFGPNSAGPVVEGFPAGLPAATPEGVKIALSSPLGEDGEMPPIPGVAGLDYSVYAGVPETSFDCNVQEFPGIYGDTEAQCQVFHMCQPNGNADSFLCPNGTMFNQQYFVCDWWYNVDCQAQPEFYGLNKFIYTENEDDEDFDSK